MVNEHLVGTVIGVVLGLRLLAIGVDWIARTTLAALDGLRRIPERFPYDNTPDPAECAYSRAGARHVGE